MRKPQVRDYWIFGQRSVLGLSVAVLISTIGLSVSVAEEKQKHPAGLAASAMKVQMHKKAQHTPEQAEHAHQIGKDVVCLCGTCPKRTISSCECGWAIQNQNAILNAVVEGKNREEIIGAYRSAYGDQVLSLLPNEGFAVTAWALPYTVALGALLAVFWVGFLYMKRSASISQNSPAASATATGVTDDAEARAELARELEDLD